MERQREAETGNWRRIWQTLVRECEWQLPRRPLNDLSLDTLLSIRASQAINIRERSAWGQSGALAHLSLLKSWPSGWRDEMLPLYQCLPVLLYADIPSRKGYGLLKVSPFLFYVVIQMIKPLRHMELESLVIWPTLNIVSEPFFFSIRAWGFGLPSVMDIHTGFFQTALICLLEKGLKPLKKKKLKRSTKSVNFALRGSCSFNYCGCFIHKCTLFYWKLFDFSKRFGLKAQQTAESCAKIEIATPTALKQTTKAQFSIYVQKKKSEKNSAEWKLCWHLFMPVSALREERTNGSARTFSSTKFSANGPLKQ